MGFEEAFAFGMVAIVLIILALLFISYIFDSLFKMKVFKLFGTCSPALAWVPFLNLYMLGRTCNGKDGQNIGIFGMSIPNWMYNFGWLAGVVITGVCGVIGRIIGDSSFALQFASTATGVFNFIYLGSIYSFLYSRIEGRPEQEVRIISVISALIGLVGLIKILSSSCGNVFSLVNDEFPEEDDNDGFGGYGGKQGGYGGGYVSDTSGSVW